MTIWEELDKQRFSFWHVAIGAVLASVMRNILGI
jgi:hypothetical protein